jgi:predicted SAM-dependent methyltransferase
LNALPAMVRSRVGLDDTASIGSRRIELGAGPHPLAGYIHLDVDWTSRHLEGVTAAWSLPFPTSWAQEILAVHMFEHIPSAQLDRTLAEWQRVLEPGGSYNYMFQMRRA